MVEFQYKSVFIYWLIEGISAFKPKRVLMNKTVINDYCFHLGGYIAYAYVAFGQTFSIWLRLLATTSFVNHSLLASLLSKQNKRLLELITGQTYHICILRLNIMVVYGWKWSKSFWTFRECFWRLFSMMLFPEQGNFMLHNVSEAQLYSDIKHSLSKTGLKTIKRVRNKGKRKSKESKNVNVCTGADEWPHW